jgi:ribosomal protein S4E
MFKVGQKVVFVDGSDYEEGTKGVIVEVDEADEQIPYLVAVTDEDGDDVEVWCRNDEIEADGEVLE